MNLLRPSLVVVPILILTAACATTTQVGRAPVSEVAAASIAVPDEPMVIGDSRGPCLPPGMDARFFAWPVKAFRPIAIPRADATTTTGAWVLYAKGGSQVAAVWSGEDLVAVDPSPTTDAPVWLDRALIDPESSVLRMPSDGHCKWQRDDERNT